ncbi:hypothetical protein LCGC14_3098210, partial [marine sediment metagenome]
MFGPDHPDVAMSLNNLAVMEHGRGRNPEAEALFAHYRVRRLDAEVLVDALSWIAGDGEGYSSAIPEPFTFIPEHQR